MKYRTYRDELTIEKESVFDPFTDGYVRSSAVSGGMSVKTDVPSITEQRLKKIQIIVFRRRKSFSEDGYFFQQMITGIIEESNAIGLEVTFCSVDLSENDSIKRIHNICNCRKDTAIIVIGSEMDSDDKGILKSIAAPFIVLDYWDADHEFNTICNDDMEAVRRTVEYFCNSGHRRIGYLKSQERTSLYRAREKGLMCGLQEEGLQLSSEDVIVLPTDSLESYKKMHEYFQNDTDLPTAVFADNDVIAQAAIKAFRELHIAVPGDISIVGFGDMPSSAIVMPSLSTIHTNKNEIGKYAVRSLMDIVNKNRRGKLQLQICSQVVLRESSNIRLKCI